MANQVLYGFVNLQNVFAEVIDDSRVRVIDTAIQRSVAEHNRQLDAVMGLFVEKTEEFKTRFKQTNGARLQPLDEYGRARPIQVLGYYDIAFPIRDAGIAWGTTFKASKKMTVGDANRITNTMLIGDRVWMRDQLLGSIFDNVGYNYTDPEHGTLAVKGLANGDTTPYLRLNTTVTGTDDHYKAQANAIDNSNDPFPMIYDELVEHPENGGEVIALVPTNLLTAIMALAGFHEAADPDITPALTAARLTGSLSGVNLPGPIKGKHDAGVWIVEWKGLPDSYILAVMSQSEKPILQREEPEASLKGFYQVPEPRNDHPYYERQWARHAGFGGNNRAGALVLRVGNGSYAVPTGYAVPMP